MDAFDIGFYLVVGGAIVGAIISVLVTRERRYYV